MLRRKLIRRIFFSYSFSIFPNQSAFVRHLDRNACLLPSENISKFFSILFLFIPIVLFFYRSLSVLSHSFPVLFVSFCSFCSTFVLYLFFFHSFLSFPTFCPSNFCSFLVLFLFISTHFLFLSFFICSFSFFSCSFCSYPLFCFSFVLYLFFSILFCSF